MVNVTQCIKLMQHTDEAVHLACVGPNITKHVKSRVTFVQFLKFNNCLETTLLSQLWIAFWLMGIDSQMDSWQDSIFYAYSN